MNDYLTERVALSNYTRVQTNESDILELFSDDNIFKVRSLCYTAMFDYNIKK